MTRSFDCTTARRWVLKIGSSLITDIRAGINTDRVHSWAQQIAALKQQGVEIIVVSSGSIVEGMKRLGWEKRPHEIHLLQVAASVGQMGLVQAYESAFAKFDYRTAQVLLTNADLANRSRYLNARNALRALLQLQVIPIVNENDTVVTDEIRLGDNDTLAGLVTNLVDADLLVLLTDQDGLYDCDPRHNPKAQLIELADSEDDSLKEMAGPGSSYGRGGMQTKLNAARRAADSGAATVIASGFDQNQLHNIHANRFHGTLLVPRTGRIAARKQWLAGRLRESGTLHIDDGAARALREHGRSLLPVGVKSIEGNFRRGDLVLCVSSDLRPVAKGLINYDSDEANILKGHQSHKFEALLGYLGDPEFIHRDNMVIVN